MGTLQSGTGGRPGAGTEKSAALTVAGAVAIVLLAAVSAVFVWDSNRELEHVRAEARAEQAAVRVRSGFGEVVVAIEAASRDRSALPAESDVLTILRLSASGRLLEDRPELERIVGDPAVDVALARARDTGALVVSAPTGDPQPVTVLVRTFYRTGTDAPTTTAERRRSVAGHLLGVVRGDALVGEDAEGLQLRDGTAVLGGDRGDPGASVTAAVPVLERRWEVSSAIRGTSILPVLVVLGLGALACLLFVLAGSHWRSLLQRTRDQAARADEQAAAVLTYAGVVQESHDLGEVVPALAVQLADRLDLDGVSFSVTGVGGGLREVFVHGTAPDRSVVPGPVVPSTAEAGETVAIHLRRAERSIGVLRVVCSRRLGPHELDQMRVAAELVTSTVVASRSLEQQQDAVDRLRTLDELKTAFLGTASHELRTPVTAIAGFATMLSLRWEDLAEDERRTFADRISANARVLESLVQDLLDFARLERGELRLVLDRVDLSVVTERVLERLEPVWATHEIAREIAPEAIVGGDVAALERIVTNLVSNAVKFSPAGSTVVVRVESSDPVRLVVEDQGPGVPAGDRDRIFVRFFRGEGDAVVRTNGVGIGLSVVRDYVDQMGGRVLVESAPAGGARFVVELARADREDRHELEGSDVAT